MNFLHLSSCGTIAKHNEIKSNIQIKSNRIESYVLLRNLFIGKLPATKGAGALIVVALIIKSTTLSYSLLFFC